MYLSPDRYTLSVPTDDVPTVYVCNAMFGWCDASVMYTDTPPTTKHPSPHTLSSKVLIPATITELSVRPFADRHPHKFTSYLTRTDIAFNIRHSLAQTFLTN